MNLSPHIQGCKENYCIDCLCISYILNTPLVASRFIITSDFSTLLTDFCPPSCLGFGVPAGLSLWVPEGPAISLQKSLLTGMAGDVGKPWWVGTTSLTFDEWQCIISSPPTVSLSVQRASRNLGEDTNQPGSFDEAPTAQCRTKDTDFYVTPGRWHMGSGSLRVFPRLTLQNPVPWGTISLSFNSCIVYYQVSTCQPHILHARRAYCGWMRHRDK